MSEKGFNRTSRHLPCPVCKKHDWCLVAADAAICMRVESKKPHKFANHAVGWYHWLAEPLPEFKREPKQDAPTISVENILRCMGEAMNSRPLEELARELGVNYSSLRLLGCVWSPRYKAWAFPMRGGDGEYRGIRLRNSEGRKWAVAGSKEGVFYAFGNPNTDALYVVEGPTDTAAGMSIGLDVVGRPSCYGGVDEVRIIVRNEKYKRVVIVADNDANDDARRNVMNGLRSMADAMFVPRCILTLPAKDMREFVNKKGTKAVLDYMLKGRVWVKERTTI